MSQPTPEDYTPLRLTPAVQAIVGLCVAVAFLQVTILSPDDAVAWFGLQSSHIEHTWWTFVTYAFVHTGVWYLAVNAFTLLVFGPRVEQAWGTKTFTLFFVWCVVGGAATHFLIARNGTLTGATAGVFGVMVAYAWLWPKEVVFLLGVLPIRVWRLVGLLGAVSLALGLSDTSGGGVGYFAHLGGVAFALLYLKRPRHVSIDDLRQRVAAAPDPTDDTPRAIPRTLPRSRRGDDVDEIVAQSKAAVAKQPVRALPALRRRDSRNEDLNDMLDKISERGLNSLTPDERMLLEEMSRRLRDQ